MADPRPPNDEGPGMSPDLHQDRHRSDQVTADGSGHDRTTCRTCDPGTLIYLTVADEWRRWALDYGHTIGSRKVAA
jgi:hypothetical protein